MFTGLMQQLSDVSTTIPDNFSPNIRANGVADIRSNEAANAAAVGAAKFRANRTANGASKFCSKRLPIRASKRNANFLSRFDFE